MSWDAAAYCVSALGFQIVLLTHFAVRLWRLDVAVRWGWIVYLLSVPAAGLAVALIVDGAPWSFWVGGLLFPVWAALGFALDYKPGINWRAPIVWNAFLPYTALYLATSMFYWWPLALVSRPLWYVAAALFAIGTALNIASHRRASHSSGRSA